MNESFETNDENAAKLQDPFTDTTLPPGMENRIVETLKKRQLLSQPKQRKTVFLQAAAVLLLFCAFFAAGWALGRVPRTQGPLASGNTRDYLLLTYNPAGFVEDKGLADEYSFWFAEYAGLGLLKSGEELDGTGYVIKHAAGGIYSEKNAVHGPEGFVSGFFIITAPSAQKAYEIAATCPHLKHNGTLELRPLNN